MGSGVWGLGSRVRGIGVGVLELGVGAQGCTVGFGHVCVLDPHFLTLQKCAVIPMRARI